MDLNKFQELPVLAILRGVNKRHVLPLFNTFIKTGLRTVEITLNTPNALDLISYTKTLFKNKLVIGAGTVLTLEQAKEAVRAGATFLVAPNFNISIAKYCVKHKIPFFPGALTPSEIYTAWDNGASMVKVFPAGLFGPKYFKDIKGPFQDIKLMAVGGVTPKNLRQYFKNGASAVAFGITKKALDKEDWETIRHKTELYVKSFKTEQ
jgi:2-dehydro-3-deoxyphosphogluconate aldolase/(4S)-4-hydroxy-2-oxoglutarate aldolase